jgi:hypothetical protein
MAKSYKLTESNVPERRTSSLYADIVADFMAQGAESMQVTIEGRSPRPCGLDCEGHSKATRT